MDPIETSAWIWLEDQFGSGCKLSMDPDGSSVWIRLEAQYGSEWKLSIRIRIGNSIAVEVSKVYNE